MWKRFEYTLRCPCCQGQLELISIEEHQVELQHEYYEQGEELGVKPGDLNKYVNSGILLSRDCKQWFPIIYGLPVLLPYETPVTQEFTGKYNNFVNKSASGFTTPKETPKPGEQFVLKSFSKEWLEYEYDGVIWGWSYEDREKTLLVEMGFASGEVSGVNFLEIGCGLGITTNFAQKNYGGDAVGVDLSLAVLKASDYFKKNPFLHFVQASLFKLPLNRDNFDLLYSHGVLHHTYSTKEALKAISEYCRHGGWTYIWVYGPDSQKGSWDRKLGHYAEALMRPMLSRMPSPVATIFLAPISLGYVLSNAIFRLSNPTLQAYNFNRALHAARDRFTPCFAFRHDYNEVDRWFKELGFENIQELDWRDVPQAVHKLFSRCTGVRGQRTLV